MKNIFLKGSLAAGALLLLFPQGQSHAAVNSYEVKVYADADKIVKDSRHIDHDILNQLGSEDKDEDFNVQYIDDGNRSNYNNKETFRVRKSEDEDSTELQYKKRYPITNGDADAAVAQAKKDGFNTDDYEVEYGEKGQTLSASNESSVNSGSDLPDASQSLDALKGSAKAPFDASLNKIGSPQKIGPVHFERHKGEIDGNKVKIENWDIGNQNVVEVSAKVSNASEAKSVQQAIVKKLDQMGIHETKDQLKTDMIFNNY
ncbi:hypothetical protein [Staphylococcus debuckii]|uniref:CYTH domain-containing protein n=1 Tax=Staphylococcus debuckii TaxID=2044912 RepID=A0ABU9EVB6_9STAP